MRDVLPDIERWHAAGKRIALATVISIVGSAPRGVGATLAVNERRRYRGSVSGGCVEPAVIEEGLTTIRTGQPKLLTYGITEEQNVEQIGLSCGGEIGVFVERSTSPTSNRSSPPSTAQQPTVRAVIIRRAGGMAAATLGDSATWLPDPELARTSALWRPHGLDDAVSTQGARLVARSRRVGDGDGGDAEGREVFFEVYQPVATLIIVGAGHISIPLTRLAKMLGYHVTVIDARAAFATRERLPDADELLVEWPDEAMAQPAISERHRRRRV